LRKTTLTLTPRGIGGIPDSGNQRCFRKHWQGSQLIKT